MRVGDLVKSADGELGLILDIDSSVIPEKITLFLLLSKIQVDDYSDELEIINETES
tara:strand:- start:434 stop:601 length:168 start_codon:yes stop_codon:yes gene_type:complete